MPRRIIPYNSSLKQLARNLRNNSTLGQVLLWNEFKGKQFAQYDFHRQKPLLNYIADFYYSELELIIEIDGRYHDHIETYELNLQREAELQKYDLTILRFTEQEVRKDMVNVIRTIEGYIADYIEKKKLSEK